MKGIIKITLIAVALASVSACSNTQYIQNIERAPIANSLSQDQVKLAIVQAATSRGWLVEEATEEEVTASIRVRNHQARVRIPYTSESYAIHYVDSVNLKHRGDIIHRNYNRWVLNLNNDIRRSMSMIAVQQ